MKWYILTDYQYELSRIIYSLCNLSVLDKTNYEYSGFNEVKKKVLPRIIEGLDALANCEKIKLSEKEIHNCIVVSKHIQTVHPDIFPEAFTEYMLCSIIENMFSLFERYDRDIADFPTLELQELLCGCVEVDQINEVKHKLLNPQDMDIEIYKILKEYQDVTADDELLLVFVDCIFHFKFQMLGSNFKYNAEKYVELEKIFSFILDKDIFRQKDNPTPIFLSDCNIVKEEIEKLRQSRLSHLAVIQKKKDHRNALRRKRYKEKKEAKRKEAEKNEPKE